MGNFYFIPMAFVAICVIAIIGSLIKLIIRTLQVRPE